MNAMIFRFLVAPKIDRKHLRPITVKAGQIVSFDVPVEGEPPPKVTWSFKGEDKKSSGRFKVENPDYSTKFQIRQTARGDSGTYTVKASNVNGSDTATVEVNILGKTKYPG